MKRYDESSIVITGMGVITAIGQGKKNFSKAMMEGQFVFGTLKRSGRQKGTHFIGAEIPDIVMPDRFSKRLLRNISLSGKAAMVTLHEAWEEAQLNEIEPCRIGLIVGGSNIQQREQAQLFEKYIDKVEYIKPSYGFTFMDSDICGMCTEHFGIKGFAYTVGGASASGQLAIIQAIEAVKSGQVDVCIALGALADISYYECQAMRLLGAMGTDRYNHEPDKAYRPFDKDRDGFIYGESCGAVVIEKANLAKARNIYTYASISGWAVRMDGNRNPNPSYEGEMSVIENALAQAKLQPEEIDYINPHGSGSIIGDETEIKAIIDSGLSHAYLNTTKSLIGHGLSAAGTVELIATVLQMKEECLHPSRNLDTPIDSSCNWVRNQPIPHLINNAITLSMGFGGINTAICLKNSKCE